jgi:hypothetical protein
VRRAPGLWLALALVLLITGCGSSLVEGKARELFGSRIREFSLTPGDEPLAYVGLLSGPLRDKDGLALMSAMASQESVATTLIVMVFAPRPDGTGDQWEYQWSRTTRSVVKLEGRSADPRGGGMITSIPTAFARGVSAADLASGTVVLQAWPIEPQQEDVIP